MERIHLETERLVIRPFQEGDLEDLHEYLSDENVIKYEPYAKKTLEESRLEMQRRMSDPAFLAVCLKDNGKLIGNLYLRADEFYTWELGYVFNAKYQHQGYATEGGRAVLAYIFDTQDAHRVFAQCNPANLPSWQLLERLGFRREGHLKQNIFFKRDDAGQPIWVDTYIYGMLHTEWERRSTH